MKDFEIRINNVGDIEDVLAVADKIFKPDVEEKKKYHDKSVWLDRLKNGLLVSAVVKGEIVGFAICYPKEVGDLHIWNVGVLPEFRKIGMWRRMYEEIIRYAKNNKYKKISLNTYKDKFPGMYSFCVNEGFAEYDTEIDSLSRSVKSKFSKKL